MRPAQFTYSRATSVAEAISQLREAGPEAKVISGGQSLLPMMRLRLAQPSHLVDINRVPGLDQIRIEAGQIHIGAMVRHRSLVASELVRQQLPLLADMAAEVGDAQIRTRGTIGGVMAHADPAGDYPTLAAMLEATIVTDRRQLPATDFFQHYFTTPLEPDELVCEVIFPAAPGPHRYLKFGLRVCDWAIVGAGAQQTDTGWRVGLTHVGPTPVRARAVEAALDSGATRAEAAELASDGLEPTSDDRASAEFRRHLARVLTRRALEQAS